MRGSYEYGPYIPAEHAQYDLLPHCRAAGGEVFSFTGMLDDVDASIRAWAAERPGTAETTGEERQDDNGMLIMQYGMKSYAE